MDTIIKCLIKRDYKSIESVLNNFDPNECISILHVFFYMHINNYIDDDQGFIIFYLIIEKYKYVSIIDVLYLNESKRLNRIDNKLFDFLKIKKDRLCINDGINEVVNKLKNSTGVKKFNDLNINNFYDTVNGEFIRLILSFTDITFVEYTPTTAANRQQWIYIQENEMINRLLNLMNIFGEELVTFMNIPIININTFNNLSFDDKVLYYKKCVFNLMNSGNTLKDMSIRQRKIEIINLGFSKQYEIILKNSINKTNKQSIPKTLNNLSNLVDKYFN